eukprot:6991797-Prymnesium_polylepis.1
MSGPCGGEVGALLAFPIGLIRWSIIFGRLQIVEGRRVLLGELEALRLPRLELLIVRVALPLERGRV